MRHVRIFALLGQVLLAITLLAMQCDGPPGTDTGPHPVAIRGTARLYEGDSCNTPNLRDERGFAFSVESGKTNDLTFDLKNGGGDSAKITLTVSNEASASGSQLVVASGSIHIVDDEALVSNEYATVPFAGQATVSESQTVTLVEAEGCAGDEVRVEIEVNAFIQPPPRAEAADPDRIMEPDTLECEMHCTNLGEELEKCASSLCAAGEYPLLRINELDSSEKSPGDTVMLAGSFGTHSESVSVALAEEQDGILYHRYRLRTVSWENNLIVADIHEDVDVGLYQVLIVYYMNLGEPARPVYMKGSNTKPIIIVPNP